MATYVIADIHGEYEMFMKMLQKIGLGEEDTLYVLGDIVDRGPQPVELLMELMDMPNAELILGNHELMAFDCLDFLSQEITNETIAKLSAETIGKFRSWQENGGGTTVAGFRRLGSEARGDAIDFLKDFLLYEELEVEGKRFVLVHAAPTGVLSGKPLEEHGPSELVWERPDYSRCYFPDKYLVTGHIPTMAIGENPRPGYIYRANNHIAIDCGACFEGGRLACLCLDTDEEFYVERGDR